MSALDKKSFFLYNKIARTEIMNLKDMERELLLVEEAYFFFFDNLPSYNEIIERKSEQEKSFVERMRSDPTKGKSLGGSNEL